MRDARDALLWNLTVVEEAVGWLPDDLRAQYPQVPWSQPTRLTQPRRPRLLAE